MLGLIHHAGVGLANHLLAVVDSNQVLLKDVVVEPCTPPLKACGGGERVQQNSIVQTGDRPSSRRRVFNLNAEPVQVGI